MRAVLYPRPNEFLVTDVADPVPGPGRVLLRVRSTTICGTDLKVYAGQFPGTRFPHVAGHEWSGEVVSLGEGVTGLKPGDRVGVEVHVGCENCPRCREGLYTLCEAYGDQGRGHAHIGFTTWGGLAELCAVPARACHLLPGSLDLDEGAFTDSIGIALSAIERGRLRPGEGVAIIGPGAFGLLALQVAVALGATPLVLLGTRNERLQVGKALGADALVNTRDEPDPVGRVKALFDGRGPEVVVEFAGTEDAAALAVQLPRRGGRVVLAGATSPGRLLKTDLAMIVRGHLEVIGSLANPYGISRRGLNLMARGLVRVKPLITHHFPLEAFAEAWQTFVSRSGGAFRVMLHP